MARFLNHTEMRNLVFILLFTLRCGAQLSFSEKHINLGDIGEASEIKGDLVISNNTASKIYLLRADADRGVKVFTSRKTMLPGDTALLVISFIPEKSGSFYRSIRLLSSESTDFHELSLEGKLRNVKTNDREACYYFGSQKKRSVNNPGGMTLPASQPQPRDISNRMPTGESRPRSVAKATVEPVKTEPQIAENKKKDKNKIPEEFAPNNLVFLVDVSSSMKDSLKLPLMKRSLHTLIDAIRPVDRITLMTYADTVKVLAENVNENGRDELHKIVDKLKAKGMTKGRTALFTGQKVSQRNYIQGGNNQIIIATDGEFKFGKPDFEKWRSLQADKPVVISVVAFGEDKPAMHNLKEISRKGKGSFIHIGDKDESKSKLLEEIKNQSRR
jgi:Mg-chelatase subunit ChlD